MPKKKKKSIVNFRKERTLPTPEETTKAMELVMDPLPEVIVKKEFQSLIPALLSDEYKQLEKNILKDGIREPLVVWGKILVDGHNRFSIAKKHGLRFTVKDIEFKNEEEVREWMINNQLGKRNLTKEQKSYLRGLQYRNEKVKHGGNRNKKNIKGKKVPLEKTAVRLAKEHGVSDRTIKNDEKYADAIDNIKDTKKRNEILSGKSKIKKTDLIKKASTKSKPKKVSSSKKISISLTASAMKKLESMAKKEKKSISDVIENLIKSK